MLFRSTFEQAEKIYPLWEEKTSLQSQMDGASGEFKKVLQGKLQDVDRKIMVKAAVPLSAEEAATRRELISKEAKGESIDKVQLKYLNDRYEAAKELKAAKKAEEETQKGIKEQEQEQIIPEGVQETKLTTDAEKDQAGLPSGKPSGETTIQAEPIQEGSGGEIIGSGVVQKTPQEEVAPAETVSETIINKTKFKNKQDVANEFLSQTGDNIERAKGKISSYALREMMRESGNLKDTEQPPYNEEQLKLIDVYDGFAKKSPFLFHTTPKANIISIIKEGLLTNKKKRFDISEDKIYLAANESIADYYSGGDDVMLRVKKGYKFDDLDVDLFGGGEGSYSTSKNIPASELEIKVGKKYIPLDSITKEDLKKKIGRAHV